jgi:transcriptional regulator GlxA family with amidase domain
LRRAVQLLTTTNLSVQDISAQLGFENPANFATAFRERMGTTPRGYRQALTKNL